MSMKDDFEKAFPVPDGVYWDSWSDDDGQYEAVGPEHEELADIQQARLQGWIRAKSEGDWVRCDKRLPEPRKPSRKAQNGILIKFDNGRITHCREISETLVMTMRNGPRQVLKFETPKPPRIVEWLDLDAATPPTAQGGEGDE